MANRITRPMMAAMPPIQVPIAILVTSFQYSFMVSSFGLRIRVLLRIRSRQIFNSVSVVKKLCRWLAGLCSMEDLTNYLGLWAGNLCLFIGSPLRIKIWSVCFLDILWFAFKTKRRRLRISNHLLNLTAVMAIEPANSVGRHFHSPMKAANAFWILGEYGQCHHPIHAPPSA